MTDEELGKALNRQWNAACKGQRLDAVVSWQRKQIGALVRLVREIPYLYEHGAELPDHQERIAAWLAEARALVGEEHADE